MRQSGKMWCTLIAFYIPKATNRHSEYVILIPFPVQQWLREHSRVLLHKHAA